MAAQLLLPLSRPLLVLEAAASLCYNNNSKTVTYVDEIFISAPVLLRGITKDVKFPSNSLIGNQQLKKTCLIRHTDADYALNSMNSLRGNGDASIVSFFYLCAAQQSNCTCVGTTPCKETRGSLRNIHAAPHRSLLV